LVSADIIAVHHIGREAFSTIFVSLVEISPLRATQTSVVVQFVPKQTFITSHVESSLGIELAPAMLTAIYRAGKTLSNITTSCTLHHLKNGVGI
jgi:hypothetical protein